MKTVKEYLLSVDRDGLLDTYLHDYPIPLFAVACFKTTLPEAMAKLRSRVNEFIEHITSLESVKTEDCVFFVYEKYEDAIPPVNTALCSVIEILQHKKPERYGWAPTDWKECIGFYISDDQQTQFHIYHVLSEIIHQATLCGWTEAEVMEEIDYIKRSLQESEKDVLELKVNHRSLEEILKAHGLPVPETSPEKTALRRAAVLAKMDYESHCYIRAAKRVRELLAESGKE